MFQKFPRTLIVACLFTLVSIQAFALPVTCVSGTGLPCVATKNDVLAGGVVVDNSGNDFENVVEAALKSATNVDVDLTLYGKSDSNPGLFTFSNFGSGSSLITSKDGTWATVDGTLISYITVKAANSFILYAFSPTSQGTYSTLGILNNGGQQPTVSHISFWKSAEVPEPATMTLLFSSFAGMGLLKRRKARA